MVCGLWSPSSCAFEENLLSQRTEEENLEPRSVLMRYMYIVPLLSKTDRALFHSSRTILSFQISSIQKNFQSPAGRGRKARMVWGFLRRRRRAPLVAADISGNYRRHYQNIFLEFINGHCGTIATYCKFSTSKVPRHFSHTRPTDEILKDGGGR